MAEADDLRTFIREIMARSDRGFARMERRMDAAAEERLRHFEKLSAQSDEIIAENRAQREALLRILDRMDGNGGTAPAG
jgi:hypothetical protein